MAIASNWNNEENLDHIDISRPISPSEEPAQDPTSDMPVTKIAMLFLRTTSFKSNSFLISQIRINGCRNRTLHGYNLCRSIRGLD